MLLGLLLAGHSFGLAFAGDATHVRPSLAHRFWGVQDGAPDEIVALAQTADGYLWLGAASGLYRFDGMRFERYRPLSGPDFLSTNVRGLFAPPTGGLWIGYRFGGFSFLNDGRVTNYDKDAASTGSVSRFVQGPDGIVWAVAATGPWRFAGSQWERLGAEWNPPGYTEYFFGFDRAGYLWARDLKRLLVLRPGGTRFEVVEEHLDDVEFLAVGFMLDADGYVMTSPAWAPRSPRPEGGPTAYPLVRERVNGLVDREGGVWMAPGGLAHFWPEGTLEEALEKTHFEQGPAIPGQATRDCLLLARDGLSQVENFSIYLYVQSKLVDREGNIWFGSSDGLHRFFYKRFFQLDLPDLTGGAVTLVADGQGGVWTAGRGTMLIHAPAGKPTWATNLEAWYLQVAYLGPAGDLWLGATSGLWHETLSGRRPVPAAGEWSPMLAALQNHTGRAWERVELPPEVADKAGALQALTQDRQGGLWVSLGRAGLYRLADGVWTPSGGRNDLPKTGVVSEFTDAAGRVWFGFTRNQLAVLEGDRVRVFGPDDGLHVGNVTAMAGRGPDVWIGGEFGLQRYSEGRLHDFTSEDDLMLRGISGIVERANGDLWLNGLTGIVHIDSAQIARAGQDPAHRITGERFGGRDGLPGFAAQIRPLPSAFEGTDGRLWFAVSSGAIWLDPEHAQHPAPPMPVTIQSVLVDDAPVAQGPPIRLPPGASNVQIGYAAVSLTAPEAIRYRYRLREIDKDWREVRVANPVSYRNLAPGTYHFTAGASDVNGAWSDRLATVEFTLLPAFYQTAWFLVLCGVAGAGVLSSMFLLRLSQATRKVRSQMEARLSERERIARELHDTLLQSVQGLLLKLQAMANRMPAEDATRRAIEATLDHADRVVAEGRDRVRDLRDGALPIPDLPDALRRVAEESPRGGTAAFDVVVEGDARDLHPMVLEESYAIGREAVTNALTHSRGAHVAVEIGYAPAQFRLRIRDDGRGIEPAILEKGGRERHWGLQGMRERARKIGAHLELRTRPGRGTEIELTISAKTAYRSTVSRRSRTRWPWTERA
jgi:signal transduction histidine kinase/ligand-binding sensor domain-containing protein